jgi:hypothetical protein
VKLTKDNKRRENNMTCWKKSAKKRYRKNSIYPEKEEEVKTPRITAEYVDKFAREVIYCGGCKQPFNLHSNELKIHCNLCNQFFHCKIAGPCLGDDCLTITDDGKEHRARYCYDCVGKIYNTGNCLCKDCY